MTHALHHVLAAGQSLSLGYAGGPALTTTQPYANEMFVGGVVSPPHLVQSEDAAALRTLSPLVEAGVETMSAGFANLVTELAGGAEALVVSAHGINGTPYAGLKKGTASYAAAMAQLRAANAIARGRGVGHIVRAVTCVHGESDHTGGNLCYEHDLEQWQEDYEADVRAVTGQSETVPMLISQIGSFTLWGKTTTLVNGAMLAAHDVNAGKIVLVGPKYHLPYSDGVHLTNEGYRWMGEDYAKVYAAVVLQHKTWQPLRPRRGEITRVGRTITARFHVPVAPLVLDTDRVTDPGQHGFEVVEASVTNAIDARPIAITRVVVSGPDTLTLDLAEDPRGPSRLRYAFTGSAGAGGGPTTGPRGNLRDSDATRSRHGNALENWCIHFDEAIG